MVLIDHERFPLDRHNLIHLVPTPTQFEDSTRSAIRTHQTVANKNILDCFGRAVVHDNARPLGVTARWTPQQKSPFVQVTKMLELIFQCPKSLKFSKDFLRGFLRKYQEIIGLEVLFS